MTIARFVKPAALLAIAALLCLPTFGTAQTPRHEISLSYGIITLDQIVDILENATIAVLTLGSYNKEINQFGGAPFLTYRYSPRGRFSAGIAAGTYSTRGDLLLMGEVEGTFKESNFVGAGEIAYRWINGRSLQLYSGLGAGLTFKNGTYSVAGSPDETKSRIRATFHVNVIGFRLGRNFGFFGELGAGYKGIVNIGLSGRF
ncbi:MAG: hypothetical protein JW747_05675 [Candidatus Aminicenantes bacterium]|nr:hypothetical protein [Candidatus Aminicenantes bacterium]